VTFAFDLGSPWTYLAAERADRLFPSLTWRPVLADGLGLEPVDADAAEARALALGLPLIWPEEQRTSTRPATRVAALAAERGCAAAYVLAASRLAYCGGFALGHPDVIAEAAAAAGLGLEEALEAAGDAGRDAAMEDDARRLVAHGADRLPALRVGRLLFAGEHRLGEALHAAQTPAARAV
jgi:2-hydroxychromene-2-carboxylate isomerase